MLLRGAAEGEPTSAAVTGVRTESAIVVLLLMATRGVARWRQKNRARGSRRVSAMDVQRPKRAKEGTRRWSKGGGGISKVDRCVSAAGTRCVMMRRRMFPRCGG